MLPVLSLIRSHFPNSVTKHRGREDVQKGKGDFVTQGSALGASHPHSFLLCLASSFSLF